jgi:hypothetical protein
MAENNNNATLDIIRRKERELAERLKDAESRAKEKLALARAGRFGKKLKLPASVKPSNFTITRSAGRKKPRRRSMMRVGARRSSNSSRRKASGSRRANRYRFYFPQMK